MDSDLGKHRPVYLNLLKIRMPVMAVVSIAHRLSGLLLFLAIPLMIWMLDRSLSGESGFAQIQATFERFDVCAITLILVWALAHHLFAGLRFLAIDFDWMTSRDAARRSAWTVHGFAVTVTIIVAARWWL